MNNNFQNPFEGIVSQMNQAKAAYDQTMSALQGQLQQARQSMNVFQNPFNPPGQPVQQQMPPVAVQATPAAPVAPPNPANSQGIPAGIEQITVLGEIKSAIEKTNANQDKMIELLSGLINGSPVKPSKTKENEGAQK